MKQAQMPGQILIYVLAIIVFALTLTYGYKAIGGFVRDMNEISYKELENDIRTEIDKVKGDTSGTVKKKILNIPGDYLKVCFVDSFGETPFDETPFSSYPLIQGHLGSGAKDKNMFLVPPGDKSFFIGDIIVEGDNCISIKGNKIVLRLESKGNHVQVSEWR